MRAMVRRDWNGVTIGNREQKQGTECDFLKYTLEEIRFKTNSIVRNLCDLRFVAHSITFAADAVLINKQRSDRRVKRTSTSAL